MRVILIVTAVFLIISLANSVLSSRYDDDDEPEDLVTSETIQGMGGEDMYDRRKRSADLDYGGRYGNDDPDSYLE
uniref:Sperm protein 6kDa n=1 Tax=Haliotis rufescens TaxID=6454 RepID=M9WA75_HALRU|nr:sperm protein 6kDa [Haliotis rufescens]